MITALKNGANANAKFREDERTALHLLALTDPRDHLAAFFVHKIAVVLLNNGANPGEVDRHGLTPLYIANVRGNAALVNLLLERADGHKGLDLLGFGASVSMRVEELPDYLTIIRANE